MSQSGDARRVTFREVLANREFRAMFAADALSVVGDQLARIAIALLVYNRSHSPFLTGLSYAVTYLPWLIGGPWLSVYADRLPRRHVMVFCDLVRAVIVVGLATPHIPIWLALSLVCLVSLAEAPFDAARAALIPDVLDDDDLYAVGFGLSSTTHQLGQVFGFAAGGVMVAFVSPRGAILADCATFLVSAYLVARFVKHRPKPGWSAEGEPSAPVDRNEAIRFMAGTGPIRNLLLMSFAVAAAAIGPETIAVPYTAHHGGGPISAGLLTAAVPLGATVGAVVLTRVVGRQRAERWLPHLAFLSTGLVAVSALHPPTPVAFVLWVFAGMAAAMLITVNSLMAQLTPAIMRGRVFGNLNMALGAIQGGFALLVGLIASINDPGTALADIALPALALVIVVAVMGSTSSSAPPFWPNSGRTAGACEEQVTNARAPARPELKLWAAFAVEALAAVALIFPLRGTSSLVHSGMSAWWLLPLFFIVSATPLTVGFGGVRWQAVLDSIPLILGLLFLNPIALVTVRVAVEAAVPLVIGRSRTRVVLANLAPVALHVAAAIWVFRALATPSSLAHLRNWLPAVAAILANDMASFGLVVVMGSAYDRRQRLREMRAPFAFGASANLVAACFGLAGTAAIAYDAANVWTITLFVGLMLWGFQTYHTLADRQVALDQIYACIRDVGPVSSEPSLLLPVLSQLRELMNAPRLAFTTPGPDQAGVVLTVTAQDGAAGGTVRDAIPGTDATSAPAPPGRVKRWLLRWRRSADLSPHEMALPVGDPHQDFGALRAATDENSGRLFNRNDLHIFEAVANQLAGALEKGRLVAGLHTATTRDALTGLANLDSLRDFLTRTLGEANNGVLLLLDLDRFHDINDTLGHDAGDSILVNIARRLEGAATSGSLVARVGGDQFALVISGQSSSEIAQLAAMAVKTRIDGTTRVDKLEADVRVTIGIARAPEHGTDATTLLRRAEIAMGNAKGSTDSISEWDPEMERDGSRRMYVLAGLRQALTEGDLTVEFQPKLQLESGDVRGFEALARWRHPELGAVPPNEFIPLAESSGLVGALTTNVMRLALETTRRWHDAGLPISIAVNISARSLDDPVLVGQVAALLTASGLNSNFLTLEITESSVMANPTRSLDVLRQLRSLGVHLSIDDFGTGYSSLNYLRGLPVHEVKIDKTFVDNVAHDGADRAVVRAIVELCDSLGLVTVAEGVEEADQAFALQSLGVSEVQGYFYGRPMPEADAFAWLSTRRVAAELAEQRQRG